MQIPNFACLTDLAGGLYETTQSLAADILHMYAFMYTTIVIYMIIFYTHSVAFTTNIWSFSSTGFATDQFQYTHVVDVWKVAARSENATCTPAVRQRHPTAVTRRSSPLGHRLPSRITAM